MATLLTRMDKKGQDCTPGNVECGDRCIPDDWECKSESRKPAAGASFQKGRQAAASATPGSSKLAQVAAVAAGSALAMGAGAVAADLAGSHPSKKGYYTEDGQPDKKTLDLYSTFQPGDMVRKEFCAPGIGCRHHYAVYTGTEGGNHKVIDLGRGETKGAGDKMVNVTRIQKRNLIDDLSPKNSQWEKVPESDIDRSENISRSDIIKRAEALRGKNVVNGAFVGNCETIARGIVEGRGRSTQGDSVSGFTRGFFTMGIVLGQGASGYAIRQSGNAVDALNSIKDIGGKDLFTPREHLIDYMFRQPKGQRKDSLTGREQTKEIATLINSAGLKSPQQFAEDVEFALKGQTGSLVNEARIQFYTPYIAAAALLINRTIIKEGDRQDAEPDCNPGNVPCGDRCIPEDWECKSESTGQKPNNAAVAPRNKKPISTKKLLTGVSGSAVALGAGVVLTDLARSPRRPTGYYTADGNPDQKTLDLYDSLEPGEMIRKEFCKKAIGCRHHYGVYAGKVDGKHKVIEMAINNNEGKRIEIMENDLITEMEVISGKTPNNSQWDRLPESDIDRSKGITPEQAFERAKALRGTKVVNGGFIGNCETIARGIAEGNARSTQGDTITGFSRGFFTAGILVAQKSMRFDMDGALNALEAINTIADVGGKNLRTERQHAIDFMFRSKRDKKERKPATAGARTDSESDRDTLKSIIRLLGQAGMKTPQEFAADVERELGDLGGPMGYEARVQLYTPYIAATALLINHTSTERKDSAVETELKQLEERPGLNQRQVASAESMLRIVRNIMIRALREEIREVVTIRINPDDRKSISGVVRGEKDYYAFSVKDGDLVTNILRPSADIREFRQDAKAHNCITGQPCKNRCIPKTSTCRTPMSSVSTLRESRLLEEAVADVGQKAEEVSDDPDLDQMSIRDLKQEASKSGVIGYSEMNKRQLVEAIKLYRKSPNTRDKIQRSLDSRKKRQRSLKKIAKGESSFKTWRQVSRALALTKRDKGLARDAIAAVVIGVSLKVRSEIKTRFINGLPESATTAEERSEKIPTPYVRGQHINFVVGSGPDNSAADMVKDLETVGQLEDADPSDDWFKSTHMVPLETTSNTRPFKGNKYLDNGNYNPIYLSHRVTEGFRTSLPNLTRKRNPDAVELAAQVAAYANKKDAKGQFVNGSKKFGIIAHGPAGSTAREAMDIISKMPGGSRILSNVSVVNLGTPDFGMYARSARSESTLTSRNDPFSMLPIRGELPTNTVKGDEAHEFLSSIEALRMVRRELGGARTSAVGRNQPKKKKRRRKAA